MKLKAPPPSQEQQGWLGDRRRAMYLLQEEGIRRALQEEGIIIMYWPIPSL
jgi:hypothetical protein